MEDKLAVVAGDSLLLIPSLQSGPAGGRDSRPAGGVHYDDPPLPNKHSNQQLESIADLKLRNGRGLSTKVNAQGVSPVTVWPAASPTSSLSLTHILLAAETKVHQLLNKGDLHPLSIYARNP